jgi:hypothetical protein
VLWGDDYPHLEGTYGHTLETLRGLFAGAEGEVRERITLRHVQRAIQRPGADRTGGGTVKSVTEAAFAAASLRNAVTRPKVSPMVWLAR